METRLRALEAVNDFLDFLPTDENNDEDIKDYLEGLPDDMPCISVYYAVLGKRPEYEARFASKSSTNDRAV